MLTLIRFIVIIADLLLVAAVAYFVQRLSWARENDRPTIVGFWIMIVVYMLDVILIAVPW